MSCVHILPPSLTNMGTLSSVPNSLMAKLAIPITDQPVPDVEIADGNALLDHFTWPQNMLQSLLLQKLWVRVCAVVRITITHHLHCHPTKLMCVRIVTLVFLDDSHELSKRKGANTPPAHCI